MFFSEPDLDADVPIGSRGETAPSQEPGRSLCEIAMNVPNALTLLRILLVPAFLIAVIEDAPLLAFALFAVAGLTDLLDGFLARRLKQKTVLGQYLDPLADKLLMTAAFVSLAARGYLPAWLAVLVVSKDVLVVLGLGVLYFTGHRALAEPSLLGKITTCLQAITAAIVLLMAAGDGLAPGWLFFLTGGMTAMAGLLYILVGFHNLPGSGNPP